MKYISGGEGMEIIKKIRLEKGMTARELGEKSNTTERYIQIYLEVVLNKY